MSNLLQKLQREDWNFGSLFIEIGQITKRSTGFNEVLYNCRSYEFARSTPAIRRAFQEAQIQFPRRGRTAWVRYLVARNLGPDALESGLPFPGSAYKPSGWASPEFLRDHVCDRLIAPPGFPRKPFFLTRYKDICMPQPNPCFPESPPVMQAQNNHNSWFDSANHQIPNDELIHLRIRWDYSDDVILQALSHWFKTYPRPRQPINLRGKSQSRIWLADLKALGAWRIWHHCGENFQAAVTFCNDNGGSPIFGRVEDWQKAVCRAQRIIDDYSRRDIVG